MFMFPLCVTAAYRRRYVRPGTEISYSVVYRKKALASLSHRQPNSGIQGGIVMRIAAASGVVLLLSRIALAQPAIPLYGDQPKPANGPVEIEQPFNGGQIIRNVTQPTLTAFLPPKENATGAAVIVAPGGAFMTLSIDSEGRKAASWLADHGVAAFVLKYRLNETPADNTAFAQAVTAVFVQIARAPTGPTRSSRWRWPTGKPP
jgi:hypothetical protein